MSCMISTRTAESKTTTIKQTQHCSASYKCEKFGHTLPNMLLLLLLLLLVKDVYPPLFR